MKSYIILGNTRDYESDYTWVNSVYLDKKKAHDRLKFLNEKLKEYGADKDVDFREKDAKILLMKKFDKNIKIDGFGTKYYIEIHEVIE